MIYNINVADGRTTDEGCGCKRHPFVLFGGDMGNMKRFFIDQALLLTVGIAIMMSIPALFAPTAALIMEIMMIAALAILCRRLLLLPLDLIIGKTSKSVYFATQCRVEPLEFFKQAKPCIWKFYFGGNGKLLLLNPNTKGKDGATILDLPPVDVKLNITYYRLSKILVDWERKTD